MPPAKFSHFSGNVDVVFPLEISIEDTYDISHRVFVPEGVPVSTLVPTDDSLDVAWFAEDFRPDGSWTDGVTGVGYRDGSTASLNEAIAMDIQNAWDRAESSSLYPYRIRYELGAISQVSGGSVALEHEIR